MVQHSLLTWIVIGIVAGALASRVTNGDRFGCCLSLVVGLAGALIGGTLLSAGNSHIAGRSGVFGVIIDIVVAFVGAVLLLALVRLAFGSNPRPPQRWR
jgi:uncharacterized membrane protein YeaQ/YmgE (transglycosylase-associated protein family)